jgi:tRNA(adenine34) deaminase
MERAIELAQEAGLAAEIPVGAVIIDSQGSLLAQANNRKQRNRDATAHAEMLAIQTASKIKNNYYLTDCTLYVTLEPCPMCAGAIIHSRLNLLVYGIHDPKTGVIRTTLNLPDAFCSNHRLKVISGIKELECRQQLKDWFRQRRN